MLRVGGENVDPAEVEALYLADPQVSAAVYVGVPDQRLHEVGCLCVVPTPGAALDLDRLLHLADGRLATFKRPRHVLEFEHLPLTASGKVQRHELAEQAIGRLG
jgi:fatty-acyl-CoA synthase